MKKLSLCLLLISYNIYADSWNVIQDRINSVMTKEFLNNNQQMEAKYQNEILKIFLNKKLMMQNAHKIVQELKVITRQWLILSKDNANTTKALHKKLLDGVRTGVIKNFDQFINIVEEYELKKITHMDNLFEQNKDIIILKDIAKAFLWPFSAESVKRLVKNLHKIEPFEINEDIFDHDENCIDCVSMPCTYTRIYKTYNLSRSEEFERAANLLEILLKDPLFHDTIAYTMSNQENFWYNSPEYIEFFEIYKKLEQELNFILEDFMRDIEKINA
ncbi:MAG: hypothetical protein WC707_04710 [Candidatus Babeliaceae bacterium]|jgi:hypothetical protein